MEGIYISADSGPKLYHIEEAKCCRPQNHPDSYDGCYDEDVSISFDHKGWSQCKQDGYYMAGFYKGGCNELYCIEKFRCCKMKKGNWFLRVAVGCKMMERGRRSFKSNNGNQDFVNVFLYYSKYEEKLS